MPVALSNRTALLLKDLATVGMRVRMTAVAARRANMLTKGVEEESVSTKKLAKRMVNYFGLTLKWWLPHQDLHASQSLK